MPTKKTTHGGKRKGAGRPPGATSAEPTINIPARAPIWLVEAFKEKWGKEWAARLRALMEQDVKRPR